MKTAFHYVYIAAIIFLIVGGMAWGWMAINGKNIVSKFFGKWAGLVYALVGLSAVFLLFAGRNIFLPFLGPSVIPCSILQDRIPEGADTTVSISVRPGAKVLYWAAEPATDGLKNLQSWKDAYLGFENAGVTTANVDGVALLKFRKPQSYIVGTNRVLPSHVHYRECRDNGWLESVQTHFISEGFQDETTFNGMPTPVEEIMPVPMEEPIPTTELPETPETIQTTDATTEDGSFSADLLKPVESTEPTPELPTSDTSNIEGFSKEPLMASVSDIGTSLGTFQIDPRLEELKQHVQQSSNELIDSNTMGFSENVAMSGTELDAAFAPPEVHPIPPAI